VLVVTARTDGRVDGGRPGERAFPFIRADRTAAIDADGRSGRKFRLDLIRSTLTPAAETAARRRRASVGSPSADA